MKNILKIIIPILLLIVIIFLAIILPKKVQNNKVDTPKIEEESEDEVILYDNNIEGFVIDYNSKNILLEKSLIKNYDELNNYFSNKIPNTLDKYNNDYFENKYLSLFYYNFKSSSLKPKYLGSITSSDNLNVYCINESIEENNSKNGYIVVVETPKTINNIFMEFFSYNFFIFFIGIFTHPCDPFFLYISPPNSLLH